MIRIVNFFRAVVGILNWILIGVLLRKDNKDWRNKK
jgi:ABC-type uncharacterized transport system permease subunit